MPSLRELLMNVRVADHDTFLFLEALVEKWESQEQICGDCGFFAPNSVFPCDRAPKPRKPLQGIHGRAGACKNFVAKVESEDTDVTIHDVTIHEPREEHHEAMTDMAKLRFERTQAVQDVDACKFIICKLQKQRDEAKAETEKVKDWAAAWKCAAKHQRAGRHAAAKVAAERIMKCGQLQETVDMYADRPFWDDMHQLVVHKLRSKLSKAKAEIERLCERRNYWIERCHKTEDERNEAKAETERLRRDKDVFHKTRTFISRELADARAAIKNEQRKVTRLQGLFDDAQQMLAAPNMAYERQAADAENWQLVLGMRPDTRLVKGYAARTPCQKTIYYWAERRDLGGRWYRVESHFLRRNPAEALRAIQEVDDAEV